LLLASCERRRVVVAINDRFEPVILPVRMGFKAHDEPAGRAVFERRRVDASHGVAELARRPRGSECRHAAGGKRRVVAEEPPVQLLRPDDAARPARLKRAGQADVVIVLEADAEAIDAIGRVGQIRREGARNRQAAARPAEGEARHRSAERSPAGFKFQVEFPGMDDRNYPEAPGRKAISIYPTFRDDVFAASPPDVPQGLRPSESCDFILWGYAQRVRLAVNHWD
jgi:hypothetical protein